MSPGYLAVAALATFWATAPVTGSPIARRSARLGAGLPRAAPRDLAGRALRAGRGVGLAGGDHVGADGEDGGGGGRGGDLDELGGPARHRGGSSCGGPGGRLGVR